MIGEPEVVIHSAASSRLTKLGSSYLRSSHPQSVFRRHGETICSSADETAEPIQPTQVDWRCAVTSRECLTVVIGGTQTSAQQTELTAERLRWLTSFRGPCLHGSLLLRTFREVPRCVCWASPLPDPLKALTVHFSSRGQISCDDTRGRALKLWLLFAIFVILRTVGVYDAEF